MIVKYRTRLIGLPFVFKVMEDFKKEIEEEYLEEQNEATIMGSAPIGRLLASMAWPAILSMSVNALYNVVDSAFVARISNDAFTAVSLVMPIQLIMVALTVGSGVGINSVISRRLGARNYDEANKASSISIRIAFFNYFIFLMLAIFLTKPFIYHYSQNMPGTRVYEYGITYMRLVLGLALFSAIEVILQKVMQATGKMKEAMICSMSGALTNVVLDPVLIFGLFGFPRLEVAGAAIATVIGQFVALCLAIFFVKRQTIVEVKLFGFKMDWKVVKDIYAVSIPSIFMQIIGSIMLIGYNTILAADQIAVMILGIYQKIQGFIFMPVFGLNQGAMPLMGYNYGARNKDRLMKTYKLGLMSAVIIMSVGLLIFQLIPEPFLKLFNADESMMTVGVPALRRISLCFLPAAYGIMTSTLFQGTGHAIYSLFGSLIRQLVGILPLAYVLYHVGGAEMSWFSFPMAEIFGTIYITLMLIKLYNSDIKKL